MFGDDVVAVAMIDRLVHHAEVISLKGDSYLLKDRDVGRVSTTTATRNHDQMTGKGVRFHPSPGVSFRPSLTVQLVDEDRLAARLGEGLEPRIRVLDHEVGLEGHAGSGAAGATTSAPKVRWARTARP